MLHNRQLSLNKLEGFSLTELLVAAVIIASGTLWSTTMFVRHARQGEVERYTQKIETGLFNLKAKQAISKTSCVLSFPAVNQFMKPSNIIEVFQPDGSLGDITRVDCGEIDDLSYRLVSREGSNESKAVEVAVSATEVTLPPPGGLSGVSLTIRVRSLQRNNQFIMNSSGNSRLRAECIELSQIGRVSRGIWDDSQKACLLDE